MERELFLECPWGVDCKKIWDVCRNLAEWTEQQEACFSKRILFECLKGKETITIQEAIDALSCFHLKKETKKRIEKTLVLLQEADLSAICDWEFFAFLCAMGMSLDSMEVSQIKINTLGEGTKSLLQKGDSSRIRTILEKSDLKIEFVPGEGELLTVYSAAFLAVFAVSERFSGGYYIRRSICVGEENPVSGMILERGREEEEEGKQDTVQVLETNVDDCSGEQLGYAIECLMKAGALDASCFPIYMKKQRPAYMLQVICKEDKKKILEDIIFRETTSIGLRRYEEKRRILPRSFQEVTLRDGHKVKMKVCEHHGQNYYYPEYETVRKVCMETGRPYRSVYDEAAAAGGIR